MLILIFNDNEIFHIKCHKLTKFGDIIFSNRLVATSWLIWFCSKPSWSKILNIWVNKIWILWNIQLWIDTGCKATYMYTKASLKNILVADFPAVWVLKPPYGRMEFFYFIFFGIFIKTVSGSVFRTHVNWKSVWGELVLLRNVWTKREGMNSLHSLRFPIMYVVVDTDKKDHKPKIIWYTCGCGLNYRPK